jgi:1,4-dihydroxy-2-naphthoyl-CoA hydrolase
MEKDTSQWASMMPFAACVGVEVIGASPAEVRGRLEWRPELCTTNGILHGAALIALADSLGAICAFLNVPKGAGTATIESKTNFFRSVRGGHVEATARALHVGKSTIVVQTDIMDPEGKRMAQVTQTQAVLPAG